MLGHHKTKLTVIVSTIAIVSIGLTSRREISNTVTVFNPRNIPQHSNIQLEQEYNSSNANLTLYKPLSKREERMKRKMIGMELLLKHFNSSESKSIEYDIMNMKPIQFDSKYKNPCWKGIKTNGTLSDSKLLCLPHYFIIGVKKSGTTDLYSRIQEHPQSCYPGFKESQWLSRLRFGIAANVLKLSIIQNFLRAGNDVRSVSFYASMFDEAATCIQSQADYSDYHSFITGDGTPATLHIHTNWELLPGNEGLKEPRYTNFHYINHINPQAKIIILFRDPVSRLYSDFLKYMQDIKMDNKNELFHNHVIKLMAAYNKCFDDNTLRQCIYNNTLQQSLIQDGYSLAESFHAGFYAFFMKELLSVFRRDQLLPILMLDYINDIKGTLKKTFKFLGLERLNKKKMKHIIGKKVPNSHEDRRIEAGNMLEETKSLLKQFYKPYNAEMAKLMDDKRYLFEEY